MFLEAALAFFLVHDLRKKMRNLEPNPWWDKVLTWSLWGIIVLFVTESSLNITHITRWVWYLALLALLALMYQKQALYASRTILMAVAPAVLVFLINDLAKQLDDDTYEAVRQYLNFAVSIAITWMITMLIISRRSQKALLKEQEKRLAEEKENRIVAARKAELEELVLERTAELNQQKEELQHALTDLQATQAQLVHREKMASLGELTAGIAHEIQNPLNFVNNFSEINKELLAELKEEMEKGNVEEVKVIATDIIENSDKINYHGRRADAIVKGMLEHSRAGTGHKEPTDINKLADEYLRLSYHGLRAKDKSFNATFATHFDAALPHVAIIPQDVGRVLLNVFNNAFYAVQQKAKEAGPGYKPAVEVSTACTNHKVCIAISDNGTGIPDAIREKIMQPFFTTKPTGQGTGLGLSLSYDIIKAHGGELKVESEEGEGTKFIILLPA